MNTGRRSRLSLAAAAVRSGDSVDVVGVHGSGRTTFLTDLAGILGDEGWNVVFVRGIASLKQFPLAALHLHGVVDPGAELRGIASLHLVAAALQSTTAAPKSVVFIDDWDDLDEASWGVVDSVRRSRGIPIVLSRLRGPNARQAAGGGLASSLEAAYVVEMLPLRIDEMEAALRERLESPIETGTLNRIFAKTAGNIGLAFALVGAAIRENHLVRDADGVWVSAGELWSSGLRSVLETQLENLPASARDALEIIASIGAIDVDTLRKLMKWDVLELLEERGLVAVLPSSASDLVTVTPSLLMDYFRHQPFVARRNRLSELIIDRIGDVDSATAVLAENSRVTSAADGRMALFAGLVREQARTRRLVASAEWEASPTPLHAIRYVAALMQSHPPAAERALEHVFLSTDSSRGDLESRAELVVLRANWLANVQSKLEEALELLHAERPLLGVFGRMLDATEVTILTNLVGIPDDFPEMLEIDEDLPSKVKLALLEAQMLVLVSSCRFKEAHSVFEKIRLLDPGEERVEACVLFGFALLGEGRHAEALRLLTSWFEEARGALDMASFQAFGAGLALCHSHSGDTAALDSLTDTMFAVGELTPFLTGPQVVLLSVTANVTAARRGDSLLVERYVSEVREREFAGGPLPAQTLAWPVSQLLILDGKPDEASDELWNSGERLWSRSAYGAGILEMLVAIEINPDRERLAQVQRRLKLIPESVAAQAQGAYVTALLDQDPEAMFSSAEMLARAGRFGMAAAGCQLAASWFDDAGSGDHAKRARELEAQVRSQIGTASLDTSRFTSSLVLLSDREEKVARLASAGLTNKEIAARLFLSVRTVDSHMRRILRKLKVPNRGALGHYFTER